MKEILKNLGIGGMSGVAGIISWLLIGVNPTELKGIKILGVEW